MNTKEKILKKALELFNEVGYNVVTARYIAKELNISVGNLHYHYKHSKDIVTAIINNLLYQSEVLILEFKNDENLTIEKLSNYLQSLFNLFFEYQFLMTNFVDVFRDVPELQSKFLEIYNKRENQFESIIKTFQQLKVFRQDLPEKLVKSVISQIFIIVDSFITYNSVITNLQKDDAIIYFKQLTLNLFLPLFSEKERDNYINLYLKN